MMDSTPGSDIKVYGGAQSGKAILCIAVGVLLAVIMNIITLVMVIDKDGYKADIPAGSGTVDNTAPSGGAASMSSSSGTTVSGPTTQSLASACLAASNYQGPTAQSLASACLSASDSNNQGTTTQDLAAACLAANNNQGPTTQDLAAACLDANNNQADVTPAPDDAAAPVSAEAALAAARKDVIVIGVNWNWPPFCFSETAVKRDDPDLAFWDQPNGFLIDMATEACSRAGLNCRFSIMGVGQVDCWTPHEQVGSALQSGMFDMCLCYTVTPGRLGRSLWPTNPEKGWTMQAMGGLLTLKEYSNTAFWRVLEMNWSDGCVGANMIDVGPDRSTGIGGNVATMRRLYRQACDQGEIDGGGCSDYSSSDYEATGTLTKSCPEGKIRVGLIQGWALTIASFGWVENQFTADRRFDSSRMVFVDEHIDDSGSNAAIKTYNHLAKAVTDKTIDMAYTYENLLEAMGSENCDICVDSNVWQDQTLQFKHTGLAFSSGGASGFFMQGNVALRDAIDAAGQDIIADQDFYCPLCMQYWPSSFGCRSHCIGCENATNPDNRCP